MIDHQTQLRIIQLYAKHGLSVEGVALEVGMGRARVRRVLAQHNIPIRGRGVYDQPDSDRPSVKLTENEREELVNALLAGHSRGDLAKLFGVTRESVRQIAIKLGLPAVRARVGLAKVKRLKDREARKKERERRRLEETVRRYEPWRKLWAEGYTLPQIAEALGMINDDMDKKERSAVLSCMSVTIVNLRKRFQDWFPYRRKAIADANWKRSRRKRGDYSDES